MVTVESRVHRILDDIDSFYKFQDEEIEFLLKKSGRIIGMYINNSSKENGIVYVADTGIIYCCCERKTFISYHEIVSMSIVELDENKTNAETLSIELKNGNQVQLVINGGKGRRKDIYEVYRFLIRVVADQR